MIWPAGLAPVAAVLGICCFGAGVGYYYTFGERPQTQEGRSRVRDATEASINKEEA